VIDHKKLHVTILFVTSVCNLLKGKSWMYCRCWTTTSSLIVPFHFKLQHHVRVNLCGDDKGLRLFSKMFDAHELPYEMQMVVDYYLVHVCLLFKLL